MEDSPYLEANSCWASQKIHRFYRNPKSYNRIHKSATDPYTDPN
jgi:hypothetical protein